MYFAKCTHSGSDDFNLQSLLSTVYVSQSLHFGSDSFVPSIILQILKYCQKRTLSYTHGRQSDSQIYTFRLLRCSSSHIVVRVCNRSILHDPADYTSLRRSWQTDPDFLKSVLDEIKTDPTANSDRVLSRVPNRSKRWNRKSCRSLACGSTPTKCKSRGSETYVSKFPRCNVGT